MSDLPFRFDEIGYWSELKLEIVEKYGAAYTATINDPAPKGRGIPRRDGEPFSCDE